MKRAPTKNRQIMKARAAVEERFANEPAFYTTTSVYLATYISMVTGVSTTLKTRDDGFIVYRFPLTLEVLNAVNNYPTAALPISDFVNKMVSLLNASKDKKNMLALFSRHKQNHCEHYNTLIIQVEQCQDCKKITKWL